MPKVRLVHAKTTQLMGSQANNQKTLAEIVQDECPSLAEGAVFNPSPFVPGGHAQTIYAFLGFYFYYAHSLISPRFTREIFRLSDGGIVDLDWALCENHTERPIVTILSGVTGTSCDFYVRRCYNEFVKMNYSVLVVHSRGCGSSKLTTPMPFHCGLTTDYREVINSIHARLPNCPLLGLSFSLGANIMAKYIGEEGEQCPLVAGIIVGNPYDMYKVIQHLDSRLFSLNKIYDIAILNFLKTAFNNNKEAIASAPIDFNVPNITNSTTIMEFTEEMTRKAFGYKSAKHLLDESSSGPFLDNIRIPVMFLNSLDDPICIEPLITYEKFINNPYLMLALTEHGGHIGYMGGTWPTSWIEHPVSQFFKAMLKHNAPAAQ